MFNKKLKQQIASLESLVLVQANQIKELQSHAILTDEKTISRGEQLHKRMDSIEEYNQYLKDKISECLVTTDSLEKVHIATYAAAVERVKAMLEYESQKKKREEYPSVITMS